MNLELKQLQDVIQAVWGEVSFAEDLSKLIAMQPNRVNNPVGVAVTNAVINRTMSILPGGIDENYIGMMLDRGSYRNLFYPNYKYDPNEYYVSMYDNSIWGPLSIAVLSQAIYYTSNNTKRSLLIDDIEQDVKMLNNMIRDNLWAFYARIFPSVLPEFRDLVFSLGGVIEARNKYRQVLLSDNWLQMINEQIRDGQLTDLEWFYYHHWVKLISLGFSLSDIDNLIHAMMPKLIEMPPTVRNGVWVYYRAWYTLNSVNYSLFPVSRTRILQSAYQLRTTPEGYTTLVEHDEIYSKLFFTGPGKKYFSPPSSCFAAGTKVRMADGSLRPIENVQVGDELETPNGGRRVVIVADIPRAGRPLYSLPGCTARFTDLHPFRCAPGTGGPRNACVDPRRAAMVLPTLHRMGMGRITIGTKLLTYTFDGPQAIVVEGLERYDPEMSGENEELVYDLILEPDETGFPDYFAGDDNRQFLVSSEVPLFVESPLTTQVVLKAISGIRLPLSQFGTAVPVEDERNRFMIVNTLFSKIIPISARRAAVAGEGVELPVIQSLSAYVVNHLNVFCTMDDLKDYNRFSVWIFENLMANHGEELESFIEMGWRQFPKPVNTTAVVIAVSVLSVNLDVEYAIPMDQHLEVCLSLLGPDQNGKNRIVFNEDCNAANTCFTRYFYKVAYFDLSSPYESNDETLEIEFRIEGAHGSNVKSLSAVGRVIWPPKEGYQHANALLYRADGVDCGLLYFDVRILSRADVEKERLARHGWNEDKKRRFVVAFGRELGAELKKRLEYCQQLFS
ncbi:hypothetical protein [Desulfolucanica intricata]|uniref:hypothetical protein n=1 Tax=Desulfolucanica intricata TaxID=1285191 RepID=UPI00083161B7|nr:hypothetical protein [Desulfolucanica intricata]